MLITENKSKTIDFIWLQEKCSYRKEIFYWKQLANKVEALCSELSAYKEKHSHDTSLGKRHVEEKCKNKKYYTFFWFILVLYVARILIPTV